RDRILPRGSRRGRGTGRQRLPHRHPVHLVLEQPHGRVRHAGPPLPPHVRRHHVPRPRTGRDRLALRHQPLGHLHGRRPPPRRRLPRRPPFRRVPTPRRSPLPEGRPRRWTRLPHHLREPPRHLARQP